MEYVAMKGNEWQCLVAFVRKKRERGRTCICFSRSIRSATHKRCLVKQPKDLSVCARAGNIRAGYACAPELGLIFGPANKIRWPKYQC